MHGGDRMLTTAEEFLLLALDGKTGDFRKIQTEYLHAGLIGAAVMELALAGKIDSDVDGAWVVDSAPVDDSSLDPVLSAMAKPGFPAKLEQVIGALMPLGEAVQQQVLERLCGRKVLEKTESRSVLLKKVTRYALIDARDFDATRQRLAQLLKGDGLPDPRDVCLLTLAKTCGLVEQLVPTGELDAAYDRLSKFASLDLIGQNVRRYLYLFERDMGR